MLIRPCLKNHEEELGQESRRCSGSNRRETEIRDPFFFFRNLGIASYYENVLRMRGQQENIFIRHFQFQSGNAKQIFY